jgi:hypothetical protein
MWQGKLSERRAPIRTGDCGREVRLKVARRDQDRPSRKRFRSLIVRKLASPTTAPGLSCAAIESRPARHGDVAAIGFEVAAPISNRAAQSLGLESISRHPDDSMDISLIIRTRDRCHQLVRWTLR